MTDKWVHKECVGMTTPVFDQLGESEDPWYCPHCQSKNNTSIIYSVPLDTTPSGSPSKPDQQSTRDSSHGSLFSTSLESSVLSTLADTALASDVASLPWPGGVDRLDWPTLTSSPNKKTATSTNSNSQPKKQLRVLNINLNSLQKKGKQLEAVIDSVKPDIILGTETWLDLSISSAEIFPRSIAAVTPMVECSWQPGLNCRWWR
eukprot:TRINITY_DN6956_c1_g1_i1.p1 TRINITY_DN6956_c1_g1~~TRINITY_DN6956_c1_g1_i1.p1  ORF type:complete len:204 (-),score=38.81 TRINITY_DN6956_c1_g1_i1:217-828(-)